jgi:S-adenosylmethionine decarboxylase
MTTVGTEWLVEASGCDTLALGDVDVLRAVFERAIVELDLRVVGEALWHKFPGEGGVTGLAMLTESHLACHTYPEFGVATFNLYCCRERPAWAWQERLEEMLGASRVNVRSIIRATGASSPPDDSASVSLPVSFESSPQTIANEGEA